MHQSKNTDSIYYHIVYIYNLTASKNTSTCKMSQLLMHVEESQYPIPTHSAIRILIIQIL